MLHTKFRENRLAGSGVEDFEGFLPYESLSKFVKILVHCIFYENR